MDLKHYSEKRPQALPDCQRSMYLKPWIKETGKLWRSQPGLSKYARKIQADTFHLCPSHRQEGAKKGNRERRTLQVHWASKPFLLGACWYRLQLVPCGQQSARQKLWCRPRLEHVGLRVHLLETRPSVQPHTCISPGLPLAGHPSHAASFIGSLGILLKHHISTGWNDMVTLADKQKMNSFIQVLRRAYKLHIKNSNASFQTDGPALCEAIYSSSQKTYRVGFFFQDPR